HVVFAREALAVLASMVSPGKRASPPAPSTCTSNPSPTPSVNPLHKGWRTWNAACASFKLLPPRPGGANSCASTLERNENATSPRVADCRVLRQRWHVQTPRLARLLPPN